MEQMNCNEAVPLVPAYLDGELGEARAGLLRKHLLECQPCRASAQDGKALKRWFAPAAEGAGDSHSVFHTAVPNGFSARVARRAFAGDTGERERAPLTLVRTTSEVMPFVLRVTALAAGLLFVLAIGMRMQTRPDLNRLSADDGTPVPVERVIEQLDQLDQPADAATPAAQADALKEAKRRANRGGERR